MSSVHISDLTSRAGSPPALLLGVMPGLWHHLSCAQSLSHQQNHHPAASCCRPECVTAWEHPGTALTLSQDMANDCSGHGQSCCHSCRVRLVLGCTWCRAQKESGCDQGASAVRTEILTAHLTKATVLAKVEEQIPVCVITFPNEFPCNFNQLLLTFPPQRVIPPHKPSEPAWRGMRGAKISRAGSALLRTGGQLPTRSFGDFTISPSAAALASPPSPLKAENFTL